VHIGVYRRQLTTSNFQNTFGVSYKIVQRIDNVTNSVSYGDDNYLLTPLDEKV
jgi:hypothetical protein